MSKISMVVAVGEGNFVIGKDGGLPWGFIKPDMLRFMSITKGHPIVMGRKTWDSLPEDKRPLKNRTNIVVTRQTDFAADGAKIVHSIENALKAAQAAPGGDEIMVIGGAHIYNELFTRTKRLYLTVVHGTWPGDTFFPLYEEVFFEEVERNSNQKWEGYSFDFLTLQRP